MAAAKVVIAPHGAGLTNLVFCSPGTKVIEFFLLSMLILYIGELVIFVVFHIIIY